MGTSRRLGDQADVAIGGSQRDSGGEHIRITRAQVGGSRAAHGQAGAKDAVGVDAESPLHVVQRGEDMQLPRATPLGGPIRSLRRHSGQSTAMSRFSAWAL